LTAACAVLYRDGVGIHWEGLIGGRETGLTIAVHGVRVGDVPAAIPRAVITGADGGSAAQAGGWVRAGGVAWAIESGEIVKIFVRGALLDDLRIGREADIERLFGRAEGTERKLGWIVYHYPARALAVAWSAREGRLEHVAFGHLGWADPVLTAKDLLAFAREFQAMVPDEKEWTADALKENPPRYYRLLRIQALLRALDLPPEPVAFVTGAFISKRPASAYDSFVERARSFLEERGDPSTSRGARRERGHFDVQWCFQYVYRFSKRVREVLTFNDGWIEAGSDFAQFMIRFTRSCIPAELKASAERADELLASIVDPEGRSIPESRLITEFAGRAHNIFSRTE
jgi:hypothetical protein